MQWALAFATARVSGKKYEFLEVPFKDFEDGVQYFCAREVEADLIISNNKKDYSESDIFVLTVAEFHALYLDAIEKGI